MKYCVSSLLTLNERISISSNAVGVADPLVQGLYSLPTPYLSQVVCHEAINDPVLFQSYDEVHHAGKSKNRVH